MTVVVVLVRCVVHVIAPLDATPVVIMLPS